MSFDLKHILSWFFFFLTTILGHVLLKISVDKSIQNGVSFLTTLYMPLSLIGYAFWGASCLLWIAVLQKCSLFEANTISTLRYILLTITALIIFNTKINANQFIGMVFISIGIWLSTKGVH